jgi:hypothetical protein
MNDYLAAWLAGAGVTAALLRHGTEGGAWHVATSLGQASMWVLDLGRLGRRPEDLPPWEPGEDELAQRDGAFGRVTHAAPLVRSSAPPGDLGRSHTPRAEAAPLIAERIRVTLSIAICSMLIAVPVSLVLGVLAARDRGTLIDLGATGTAPLGVSLPNFRIGIAGIP